MDFKKDYYNILEVGREATKEEIKASYRKLAMKYHPDRNQGDSSAEEIFKLINEANEILSNDILRHEYDEYIKTEKEWHAKQEQENKSQQASELHKRTYQKTTTHTKEKRVYIRGQIIIKYWANLKDAPTGTLQTEFEYKINPTETKVTILETEIHHPNHISTEYLKSFKESEIFITPIPQPINCIIHTSSGDEYYNLELKDIRIRNIKLEGITKHEGQSFGTLKGEVYAYTPKIEIYNEVEDVTECFGETGNLETKKEGGTSYYRKEYYNPDCTTYWSEWYPEKITTNAGSMKSKSVFAEASGCLQWWWIPFLLLFLIRFPGLLIGFLIIGIISLLFYFGGRIISFFSNLLSFLVLLFFIFILISAIYSFSRKNQNVINHDSHSYDTFTTTKTRIKKQNINDTASASTDSVINHFIHWKDYDSTLYGANLAIAVSSIDTAIAQHNELKPVFYSSNLSPVYSPLIEQDRNRLNYIYKSFDSIKVKYHLDEIGFAKMLVSCIQSIPYYIVVDRDCTDNYNDEFTQNYLNTCNRDCCIGYEKFGVRSPAEFMSDLKGDCDTRSLFLYAVLKRYNYNVALISSRYYKHAMIAINFINANIEGLAMNIHDKNYYLWETTSAGFNVGVIPPNLQNLTYWDISLLNEIK